MDIVITGASRGIGFETVKLFLNKGHRVFAISRSIESLIRIQSNFDTLYIIQGDLANELQLQSCVEQITKLTDNIDCLINNAGYLVNKSFEETSRPEFDKTFNINIKAPYFLTQKLLPLLAKAKGSVINIGSMGGYYGSAKFPGLSAYSSSKGAIATLSECLAEELKEYNVRVSCLALGAVQTEMLEQAFPGFEADVAPDQMADFIYNFIDVSSKFINGKIIPVSINTP